MKKFLAMIMALALVFSMSTVAFAATETIEALGNSAPADVKIKYTAAGASTYYVEIEWPDLTFTYNANKGTWDTTNHEYATEVGWLGTSKTISVTNHSDAPVVATATFGSNGQSTSAEYGGVRASVYNTAIDTSNAISLVSAAEAPYYGTTDAPSGEFTVAITENAPTANFDFTLDTLIIAIKAPTP